MSKERDLLGRWYNGDLLPEEYMKLMKETKELLAQPEEILEYGKVWEVKEKLESKYREGYMDGKAFKDRHITIRDHFAGLAMQGILTTMTRNVKADIVAKMSYVMADAMLAERE